MKAILELWIVVCLVMAGCSRRDSQEPGIIAPTDGPSGDQPAPRGTVISGGGDATTAEFFQIGRSMFERLALARADLLPNMGGKSISDFQATLERTRILVIRDRPLTLRGRPVDAINYPEKALIELDTKEWARYSLREKRLLVIHEVLALTGVSEERYGFTISLLSRLSSQSIDMSSFRIHGGPALELLTRMEAAADRCRSERRSPCLVERAARQGATGLSLIRESSGWNLFCRRIHGRDPIKFPLLLFSDNANCELASSSMARFYVESSLIELKLESENDPFWQLVSESLPLNGISRVGHIEIWRAEGRVPKLGLILDNDR